MDTKVKPEDLEKVEAVLFDMDGLILDTERMSQQASQAAAASFGYQLDKIFSLGLIGRNGKDARKLFEEKIAANFPYKSYEARFYENYDRAVRENGIPVMKGVFELLDLLDTLGIRRAVATSTHRAKALEKLEMTGLLSRFELVVAGDQIEKGKPFPDIYLKAAKELGIDPSKCLVLEDSYPGVRAGHASGALVIMIPDLLPPTEEMIQLTNGVMDSLLELLPILTKLKACQKTGTSQKMDKTS